MIKIAENCNSNLPMQQYVFTRIEEILCLTGDLDYTNEEFTKIRAKYFASENNSQLASSSFFRAIRSTDAYLQRSASVGLAALLVYLPGDLPALIDWIIEQLTHEPLETSLPPLLLLMRSPEARKLIADAKGISLIVSQLIKLGVNGNAQQIYELTFCLWTVSLDKGADHAAFLASGAIRVLSDLLASAPSRKVVRMCLATLHNLAHVEDESVLMEMLTSGLQRLIETMIKSNAHTQTGDIEVEADAKALYDALLRNFRELSTFDRWVSEVQSGALR